MDHFGGSEASGPLGLIRKGTLDVNAFLQLPFSPGRPASAQPDELLLENLAHALEELRERVVTKIDEMAAADEGSTATYQDPAASEVDSDHRLRQLRKYSHKALAQLPDAVRDGMETLRGRLRTCMSVWGILYTCVFNIHVNVCKWL